MNLEREKEKGELSHNYLFDIGNVGRKFSIDAQYPRRAVGFITLRAPIHFTERGGSDGGI
jgi:hypothetical protein